MGIKKYIHSYHFKWTESLFLMTRVILVSDFFNLWSQCVFLRPMPLHVCWRKSSMADAIYLASLFHPPLNLQWRELIHWRVVLIFEKKSQSWLTDSPEHPKAFILDLPLSIFGNNKRITTLGGLLESMSVWRNSRVRVIKPGCPLLCWTYTYLRIH